MTGAARVRQAEVAQLEGGEAVELDGGAGPDWIADVQAMASPPDLLPPRLLGSGPAARIARSARESPRPLDARPPALGIH